jgi:site-specific recombinase XerD
MTKDILKCLKVPLASKCRVERKLTQEEVHAILKKAKGKTKLLVCCLFFLGLRVSEALKLKKRDVTHGIRLTFSVMGKGNKPRDVIAGKATSS